MSENEKKIIIEELKYKVNEIISRPMVSKLTEEQIRHIDKNLKKFLIKKNYCRCNGIC